MSYIQEIISIKCFLYASIQKMYRIINAAILYWFYERSILNFKKKNSQYTYYIQCGSQNLEPFV